MLLFSFSTVAPATGRVKRLAKNSRAAFLLAFVRSRCYSARMSAKIARIRLAALVQTVGSASEAARQLGVSHVSVLDWLLGSKIPAPPHRKAIEIWSRQGIPVDLWETPQERAAYQHVEPLTTKEE